MSGNNKFEGSVDGLFPADLPGTGQPLENTYELIKLKSKQLQEKREADKQFEVEAYGHGESTNYIGYDPLPDLPYQEPKSIGWDDPQYSRNENKTKGAGSGPYLTLEPGPPRSRDNQSRNPARQLYGSTQGSSYSKDDPRRFFCLDPAIYSGEIIADTNWQSGKSNNQMIYDHACENAGYWTTNGGPYCNWRNFNITSGDGGGKSYKPAILEAETKRGQLKMVYNLGHGTMRATPEGYDMNITGASGYISPVADKSQNTKDSNIVCSINPAHMYLMYRSDLTNEEFEQLADDIENFPIGDIHDAFNSDNPYRIFTDEALIERLSKKVPYSPYRETYINVLAKLIGNLTKRRSPDVTAIMRLFKSGELTFLTAIEWFVSNCAHHPTHRDWFSVSGLSLEELLNGATWLRDGEPIHRFHEILQNSDFSELISTYGKKPPKPPKPPGGGGDNNNRPNRPNRPPGSNANPYWRDAWKAWHKLAHPNCPGPPCSHINGGPDYDANPGRERMTWPEYMWTKWHEKEHKGCEGEWSTPSKKGKWCPHLPGGYIGSGHKGSWDRLSEKNQAKFWQKYHDFLYPSCPGKWEPQRSLFPDSGGYCWHHPRSDAYEPSKEHAEKIKQDLIDKDERFEDWFDARDKGNNIGSIEKPGLDGNSGRPSNPKDWRKYMRNYFDNLTCGKHEWRLGNGGKLEVKKNEEKIELTVKNEKKDRDVKIEETVNENGETERKVDINNGGKDRDIQLEQKVNDEGKKETKVDLNDGNEHKITTGPDGEIELETKRDDDSKATITKDPHGKIEYKDEFWNVTSGTNEQGQKETKVTGNDGRQGNMVTDSEGNDRIELSNPNGENIAIDRDKDGNATGSSSKGGNGTVNVDKDGNKEFKVGMADGTNVDAKTNQDGTVEIDLNQPDNDPIKIERDQDGDWEASGGSGDSSWTAVKEQQDNGNTRTKLETQNGEKITIEETPDGQTGMRIERPGDDTPTDIVIDKDSKDIRVRRGDNNIDIAETDNGGHVVNLTNTDHEALIEIGPDGDALGKIQGPDGSTTVRRDKDGNTEFVNDNGNKVSIKPNDDGSNKITSEKNDGSKVEAQVEENGDALLEQTDKDGKTTTIKKEEDKITGSNDDGKTIDAEVNEDGDLTGKIGTEDGPDINFETNKDGDGSIEFEGIPDWFWEEEGQQKVDDLADKGINVNTDNGNLRFEWTSNEGGGTDWWPEDKPAWWPGEDRPERPEVDLPDRPEDGSGGGVFPNRPEGGVGGGTHPDRPEVPNRPNRPDLGPGASAHDRLREYIRLNGPIDCGNDNWMDVDDRGNITIGGNIDKDDVANNNDNIDREDLDRPIPIPGGTLHWDDMTGKITWVPKEPVEIPDSWKEHDYPGFHLNLKDPNSDKEINAWKDNDGNLIIDGKPADEINVDPDLQKEIKELINTFKETLAENRPGLSLEDLSPENQKKWKDKLKEWQEKFDHLHDTTDKLETIKKAYDWATFLSQFGIAGAIIGIWVGGMKGLIKIVGKAWSSFKTMDYLGELTVGRAYDEFDPRSGGPSFPNRTRDESKTQWTNFYPKYFNKEINGISQMMAQTLLCRFNGYLIDCNTVEKNSASISRLEFNYLTPTHGIGLAASDYDLPYYRVLPRAYPDPGRRHGTANYESNPRRGETTSLKLYRDHVTTQAEWTELASLHRSYWQPDLAQIIRGTGKQYDFKTQGGLTKKTGTQEDIGGEVWRTSGYMNHNDCAGFYQQNIFTEHGFGIFCDVNYRSNDSSHNTWMELSTNNPKPWPFKDATPRVTMDLEILQLNSGSIHKKTAKFWALGEVILNFFNEKGERKAIPLKNVEDRWSNRQGGTGYRLHGGKIGDVGVKHQFYHLSLKDQQANGNSHHARAPLHMEPINDDWKGWLSEKCTFIGFSISSWPQDQSSGDDSDSVIGVGGNSWKAFLLKRLRFVEEFPNVYHTSFPIEVTEDHKW